MHARGMEHSLGNFHIRLSIIRQQWWFARRDVKEFFVFMWRWITDRRGPANR